MELAALVDRIYEAAVVPDAWMAVLRAMEERSSGAGAAISTGTSPVRWIATEVVDALIRDYPDQPHVNSRIEAVIGRRDPGFVTDHDLFGDAALDRDPFYAAFLRPRDLGWCAANVVFPAAGNPVFFSVEKRYSDGPVSPDVVADLNAIRPHLARSATLATQFALERTRERVDILEGIEIAAAVVDASHRLRYANALFQALMPHVVRDDRTRLAVEDAAADRQLAEAFARSGGGDGRGARSIPIRARARRPGHVLHLLPVRRSAQDIFGGSTTVVLLLPTGPGRLPDPRLIESLLDLTPAEARVAQAIADGLLLKEIARRDGLSPHTVKTQLRSVFAKTGTRRQSDLTRLIGGLGRIPPDRP